MVSGRQDDKLIAPYYEKDCIPESLCRAPLQVMYAWNNCMVLSRESWQGFNYTGKWLPGSIASIHLIPRSYRIKCCFPGALFSAQEAPRAGLWLHTLCAARILSRSLPTKVQQIYLMPGDDPIHECGLRPSSLSCSYYGFLFQ